MVSEQLVRSFTHVALSPDPDLAVAALMIARVEYPKLDARPYLDELDPLGREAAERVAAASDLPGDVPPHVDPITYARVTALNDYLFSEQRFVGNDVHYEDPRNSFLNEVLDRRTGIPITLALVYMEVARRAGIVVEGINFPGHFLVRCPARRGRTPTRAISSSTRTTAARCSPRTPAASCCAGTPATTRFGTRHASATRPSRRFSRGCCST